LNNSNVVKLILLFNIWTMLWEQFITEAEK